MKPRTFLELSLADRAVMHLGPGPAWGGFVVDVTPDEAHYIVEVTTTPAQQWARIAVDDLELYQHELGPDTQPGN